MDGASPLLPQVRTRENALAPSMLPVSSTRKPHASPDTRGGNARLRSPRLEGVVEALFWHPRESWSRTESANDHDRDRGQIMHRHFPTRLVPRSDRTTSHLPLYSPDAASTSPTPTRARPSSLRSVVTSKKQNNTNTSAALVFAFVAASASVSLGPGDFKSFTFALGSSRHHSRASKGHHSSSTHASSGHDGRLGQTSLTSGCLNVPADNAAGTYQFSDRACASGAMGSVPGCMGDKTNCRFCQTSIVPKHSRNEGWPTCPARVCAEMKALGCKGETAESKREVLWQLAREKALTHNELVKGISVGMCGTAEADRKIGRHQFSDEASCKDPNALGAGCLGHGSSCRFCQLSTAKHKVAWPTCPDVVCKKWKVSGGCEQPLTLVTVPPEHPPKDFDVETALAAEQRKMKDFLRDRARPEANGGGGEAPSGDGSTEKTTATGDLVVDLLQSEDRGAHGLDEHLKKGLSKPVSQKTRVKNAKRSIR